MVHCHLMSLEKKCILNLILSFQKLVGNQGSAYLSARREMTVDLNLHRILETLEDLL